jgi:hypothetical protein
MLIPSPTANIANSSIRFLSILDRENGDADQWLIAAATTEKLINRESKRIAAEMATNLNPAEVAELFGSLFRPSYLPTAESTQPVQYILAISYKSEQ